jgi:hypothetical protein
MDPVIRDAIDAVDVERIRKDVLFLACDPLPCRVLNFVRPGSDTSTLCEADAFIERRLDTLGFDVERDWVPVQAFRPDPTVSWGFQKPDPCDPWFDAVNLQAVRCGTQRVKEVVVLVAHKDSQSWLDQAPGAYDNAVGVAALLEIARLLDGAETACSVMFLFCNEEHWPWTSVAAAEKLAKSPLEALAVLNIDSIGGKQTGPGSEGLYPNVIRFTTAEGKGLADFIGRLNRRYRIGISHSTARCEIPNDDDGSFIMAGIPRSVLFIGSYPYADPNYHTVTDTVDRIDFENVRRATQLALATVIAIGRCSEPDGSKDLTGL